MEETEISNLPEDDSIKRVNNKQYALVALVIFFLFMVGIILYGMGFFKENEKVVDDKNQLGSLAPPTAKSKNLENEKYKYSNQEKENAQGSSSSAQNLRFITGKNAPEKRLSNEDLNSADFKAVDDAAGNNQANAYEKKAVVNRRTQARLMAVQKQQAYYANPNTALYRKSKEEIREEQIDKQEADVNRRTAQVMLKNLENYQKNPQIDQEVPLAQNADIKNRNLNLETSQVKKVSKEEEATEIVPEIEKNTIGKYGQKAGAFYGLTPNVKKYYTDNEGILAVIHGDGEDIAVQNGSIIKLRLLENTSLIIKGTKYNLPAGTLLTGQCNISSDRVMISAKSLRIETIIYPITLSVFDLDGQMGLHVPNLVSKNMLTRELVNAGNQSVGGTNFYANSGSIGTQVGTQMAVNASRSLMNGAKSIFRTKMANPKVTIKSNYKIILKSSNLTQNNTQIDEEL